jgi:hypothetical protein
MKYKLRKNNIVKSDFELEYEPRNFTDTLLDLKKRLTEMDAQNRVYIAKRDNVSRNHPHVLKRTEEERNAIWLYQENHIANRQAEGIIKGLKKGIKDVEKEMKEITKQTGIKFD